jgi:hypothetical protein
MSTNTELLREILQVVNHHTIQLGNLESRVSSIETRVSSIETRVSTIETRLSNTDAKLSQYIDKNSKIQENVTRELIYTILRNHIYRPIKIDLHLFYDINGDPLTDFDGCLFLYEPFVRMQTNTYRNNSAQIHPNFKQNEVIIIEAKRNTTKKKIDTKLRQLARITGYLQSPPNLQNVHSNFRTMSKQYRLESWPTRLNLIFASDDINHIIKPYIHMIYNGITKDQYDKYSLNLLRSDLVYQEFMKIKDISSTVKHKVRHSKSLDDVYAILTHDSIRAHSEDMIGLIPLYAEMKPYFDLFKEHIGYAQFNTLTFPRLIPFEINLKNQDKYFKL